MKREVRKKIISCFRDIVCHFLDCYDEHEIKYYECISETGMLFEKKNRKYKVSVGSDYNRVSCEGHDYDEVSYIANLYISNDSAWIEWTGADKYALDSINEYLYEYGLIDIVNVCELCVEDLFVNVFAIPNGFCAMCPSVENWVLCRECSLVEFKKEVVRSLRNGGFLKPVITRPIYLYKPNIAE